MLSTHNIITISVLIVLCISLLVLSRYILKRKKKNQLEITFLILFGMLIFWMSCAIAQIICTNLFNMIPIYFDYFTYISVCFLPIVILFMSLIFARTKITFKMEYLLLFIIPITSLIILWTNDFHHLFYKEYSVDASKTVFGKYFFVHTIYTYALFAIALVNLIRYSIKK